MLRPVTGTLHIDLAIVGDVRAPVTRTGSSSSSSSLDSDDRSESSGMLPSRLPLSQTSTASDTSVLLLLLTATEHMGRLSAE